MQGVGFRPFIFRLAEKLQLTGWVNNSSCGVFIELEGPRVALESFLCRLDSEKPAHSFIQSLESCWLDAVGHTKFEIRASDNSTRKSALILPDIATCPDCLRDIFDPSNRRYAYPFTNCTHCGPRFSIIEALPYDRAHTSMKPFTMCPSCQAEYDDPRDRRFHAQPNACPVCGPSLELWDSAGAVLHRNHDALLAAAGAIRRGEIIAVKGIGGFHLMADARNSQTVLRLRERKHREEKPFALLFPSLVAVKQVCAVSPVEERLLNSPAAPIVLLAKVANEPTIIGDAAAPGNPQLGVMLAANPLHHLLVTELGFPVVATSANLSDEPICTDEFEALHRLRGIADLLLVHNRPIVRHVDDSIVRVMLDREMVLRRARGYAPLPVAINAQSSAVTPATVLAVGAHLKNSVALAVGKNIFISQHIGDLETVQANNAFRRVTRDLPELYDVRPEIIAADLHPDYLSTQFANEISLPALAECGGDGAWQGMGEYKPAAEAESRSAGQRSPKLVGVQHHLAHVLSCVAENEVPLPVLGVAWDGTGYGGDRTIWGGEFFQVGSREARRIAHLRPFRLVGGDKAVKEPRRVALGLLYELYGESAFEMTHLPPLREMPPVEMITLKGMLQRRFNSPPTSSMGRLFDAVASLVNLRQQLRFEGQAAMELEYAIGGLVMDEFYSLPLVIRQARRMLDWSPLIEGVLKDVANQVAMAQISAKFHNGLAEAVVSLAKIAGEKRIVLSGGCFQNRYLTERCVIRLREESFQPYWHQRVPPNDGGIALGQVFAARNQLELK